MVATLNQGHPAEAKYLAVAVVLIVHFVDRAKSRGGMLRGPINRHVRVKEVLHANQDHRSSALATRTVCKHPLFIFLLCSYGVFSYLRGNYIPSSKGGG